MRRLPDATAQATLTATSGAYRRVVAATFTRGVQGQTHRPTSLSVTQDGRTSQRWSGSVTLHLRETDEPPVTPSDLITPFGTRVAVSLGIENPITEQPATVAYGTFAVESVDTAISASGRTVTARLADLSNRIAANRWQEPLTMSAGTDLADVAAIVATNRDPSVDTDAIETTGVTLGRRYTFGGEDAAGTDPWSELNSILGARGWRAWFNRDGQLVVDVATLPPPHNPRPVAPIETRVSFTNQPPNVVVARGTGISDEDDPPVGVWEDDDESSPTNVDGPYGRRTEFLASPLLTNPSEARQAARTRGERLQGAGAAWTVVRPFDPTWDPDDGALLVDATNQLLLVDSVSIDATGNTTLSCHAHLDTGDPA